MVTKHYTATRFVQLLAKVLITENNIIRIYTDLCFVNVHYRDIPSLCSHPSELEKYSFVVQCPNREILRFWNDQGGLFFMFYCCCLVFVCGLFKEQYNPYDWALCLFRSTTSLPHSHFLFNHTETLVPEVASYAGYAFKFCVDLGEVYK